MLGMYDLLQGRSIHSGQSGHGRTVFTDCSLSWLNSVFRKAISLDQLS